MARLLLFCLRLKTNTCSRYHTHPKYLPYPSRHVSIRKIIVDARHLHFLLFFKGGAQEDLYAVMDVTKGSTSIIEEVEISRAMFEIYEGGVVNSFAFLKTISSLYFGLVPASRHDICGPWNSTSCLHVLMGGFFFQVKEVGHDSKVAKVVQADVNWITSPR
jgi:DEAD/DEAH box helicase domain-containing protein